MNRVFEFVDDLWWRVRNFFEEWIFPGWSFRNFFWKRYDIVRLHELKRTEYCDVVERLYQANRELLRHFIEDEKPEEHVVWYGLHGHKYNESEMRSPLLYPEYDNEYVMDLLKKAYNWFEVEKPAAEREAEYLLGVWYDWLSGKKSLKPELDENGNPTGNEIYSVDPSSLPKSLSFFDDKDLDWDILDKHLDGDRQNLLKYGYLLQKHDELNKEIWDKTQKMLHLCIELRGFMWT